MLTHRMPLQDLCISAELESAAGLLNMSVHVASTISPPCETQQACMLQGCVPPLLQRCGQGLLV
jgi:hypothetical protein